MPLEIRETFVNATENSRFETTPWEPADIDDKGRLFRALQKEFGRCVSKIYIDTKDGTVHELGWVFQKRMQYEGHWHDTEPKFYLREMWIEVRQTADITEGA